MFPNTPYIARPGNIKARDTDASGTFNEVTPHTARLRMHAVGVQLMNWFGMACEPRRDWRNDTEGPGTLFSNHIPNYRDLMTTYFILAGGKA
ncbi:MAG: putative hydrolase YcaC [Gammaproteobacteria bacterium]|nr:putative hydrolase YcaC [Gammaproteobacteria bacterium]